MIITAKRNLNIRKRPDPASDRVGIILAGKQIEVEGTVVGEDIDGNAVWFVDRNHNFYWSGGVESAALPSIPAISTLAPSPIAPTAFDQIFVDYSEWVIRDNPAMKGKLQQDPLKIAVLDSGIYEDHPDFKGAFDLVNLPSVNFSDTPSSKDVMGHGTHVAGLIGARSDDKPGIVGVAPNCVLWNIKVNDDENNSTGKALMKGLSELKPGKVNIVNLSLNVPALQYSQIKERLKEIAGFAIIVAAAGNNETLLKNSDFDSIFCPAIDPFVISVGAINDDFFRNERNPRFHPRLDFMLPENLLVSCSTKEKGFYKNDFGSSMATALVSGIIARLVKTSDTLTPEAIRSQLKNIAQPYSQISDLKKLTLIKPQ
jgi:subtilisin family serine protease